jgi:hypothetical protein
VKKIKCIPDIKLVSFHIDFTAMKTLYTGFQVFERCYPEVLKRAVAINGKLNRMIAIVCRLTLVSVVF